MIEAKALSKCYNGTVALHPLDLRIEGGEMFCLLGANGAGKTTTILFFLKFFAPTSGTAMIGGPDVTRQPLESKRMLAYIPDQVMLYKDLTGIENLEYFTGLAGGQHAREEWLDFLQEAGLARADASKRVGVYSKGIRQKVGIGIAIAKKARALLLDEPTPGLDPKVSNEFTEQLKRLSACGTANLMGTHDLFRAKETGTRVGIMTHGCLVARYATSELGHAELERTISITCMTETGALS